MSKIQHIFFDLDNTLWDFDRNSNESLHELSEKLIPDINPEDFIKEYKTINEEYWARYRKNLVSKEELRWGRFYDALKVFFVDDKELSEHFADQYLSICPLKPNLVKGAKELLEWTSQHYKLHIITNGFEEVQGIKIKNCKIDHYFDVIMTSERAYCKKPSPDIFKKSLKEAGARVENALMVGDSWEADILGAQRLGMKALYFNPSDDRSMKNLWEVKEYLCNLPT